VCSVVHVLSVRSGLSVVSGKWWDQCGWEWAAHRHTGTQRCTEQSIGQVPGSCEITLHTANLMFLIPFGASLSSL
jgi:hypothetical protein